MYEAWKSARRNEFSLTQMRDLDAEAVRRKLSTLGWRFRGYTPHLSVTPEGRILKHALQAKGCWVVFDLVRKEFMIRFPVN